MLTTKMSNMDIYNETIVSFEDVFNTTLKCVDDLIDGQQEEEQRDDQESFGWYGIKNVLDRIWTIPKEVEKMTLYNMMVRANQLIDDSSTTATVFYQTLPNLLIRFGTTSWVYFRLL